MENHHLDSKVLLIVLIVFWITEFSIKLRNFLLHKKMSKQEILEIENFFLKKRLSKLLAENREMKNIINGKNPFR